MNFVFNRQMGMIVAGVIVATYAQALIAALVPSVAPGTIASKLSAK